MNNEYVLKDLKPHDVFMYFEEITRIPRGSGNEKAISDYLVSFAKKHSLDYVQDKAMNIVIRKKGTLGYENADIVILQGHMDMVNEKNVEVVHDFEKDPLKLRISEDTLSATGTTLGADNGIAVAMSLAILASKDSPHPPIEALFTTEEETGMGGAHALNANDVKGRKLINIDSEEEGKLLVSCSGGLRDKIILPIEWGNPDEKNTTYMINVKGLKGGHSGMEINKGRANSNEVMGRILFDILKESEINLVCLNGGSKNNAIPRETSTTFSVKPSCINIIEEKIKKWNIKLKNEFRTADPKIVVEIIEVDEKPSKIFSKDTTDKAIKLLYLIPNGIKTMSMDIKDLVESSTNLGVVTTCDDVLTFDSAVRSSIRSLKDEIVNKSVLIAETFGAKLETESAYPEWQYDKESGIRNLFQKVYREKYNTEPEIVAIHAGVECGLFKEKFGEIDMISFGPNLYDVHTPDEHLSISSVQRTYEYLLDVLKQMK